MLAPGINNAPDNANLARRTVLRLKGRGLFRCVRHKPTHRTAAGRQHPMGLKPGEAVPKRGHARHPAWD